MRGPIMLGGLVLVLATGAQAATLNKCIDANDQVTYSNLPCRNARETRAVEIDPAPTPDPVKPPVVKPAPAARPVLEPKASFEPTTTQINMHPPTGKPGKRASPRQCDSLTEQLGKTLDKMDQAHRNGYTQEQMIKWNQEIDALQSKKQQSGCF